LNDKENEYEKLKDYVKKYDDKLQKNNNSDKKNEGINKTLLDLCKNIKKNKMIIDKKPYLNELFKFLKSAKNIAA
jgi:hypothetical protein